MPGIMFAEVTVSTSFIVIAYLSILAMAVLIIVALFDPGLRYRVSASPSESNDSDDFLHMLEALVDAKVNQTTRLTVLTNGPTFYEAELEAIRGAERSVNLEAYIFQKGEIGQRFVTALTERSQAGVTVNVVLDGVGSAGVGKNFFSDLKKAGGNVVWYNGMKWNKLPHFNNRTHRELLVVDGRTAFIGGAGVADHWFKDKSKHPRWRDTMVKVEGDAVPHLQATFAENWLESCGEVLFGPDHFVRQECERQGDVLIVNSTPSGGGATRARMLFQVLLASATKTIHITTPYFLPDRSVIDELVRAVRERNVEVVVLVPGKRSDHMLTRSSSRHAYGKLLKAGASIHEYEPSMIHAKILLIDSIWGVVGSTNFDNRSFGINDEVNLAARDPDFTQRLQQDFAKDLACSRKVTYQEWKRRPVLERAPELLGWVLERQQ
ncbi:MAG: cardiolipin synthase B [Acidobacteria bacterium]|nr:MAG: cardiolipin synthase B [Acidobacteriales bacterium 13_1_40CM_3_55_5]PYV98783.1 MAG: cardiolipin synthase B [Acidobacteriota bacterium]